MILHIVARLIFLFILSLYLLLNSCSKNERKANKEIQSIQEFYLSVELPDSIVNFFMFSPLDTNKLWIGFHNKKFEPIEFNPLTQSFDTIKGVFKEIALSTIQPIFHYDNYDSLIWISAKDGLFLIFDRRTKEIQEIKMRYIYFFVSMPKTVLLMSYDGLYEYDRKTKEISNLETFPKIAYNKPKLLDTNTIYWNGFTYSIDAKKKIKGLIYDNMNYYSSYYFIEGKEGILLLNQSNDIYIKQNGLPIKKTNLVFDNSRSNYYRINAPYIWQILGDSIYVFNIKTEKVNKYPYIIVNANCLNSYYPNYCFYNNKIWAWRNDQIIIIDIINERLLIHRLPVSEYLSKFLIQDNKVFMIINRRLIVTDINRFVSNFKLFNEEENELEIKNSKNQINSFYHTTDSLKIMSDSSEVVILEKLNFLKEKYSKYNNTLLNVLISNLEVTAFSNVKKEFPKYYEYSYKNKKLPMLYRKYCINYLIQQYAKKANTDKVFYYVKDYKLLLGNPEKDSYTFKADMDSLNKFIRIKDSLDNLGYTNDTIEFAKAFNYATLCRTNWSVHNGVYFDLSLVENELMRYIKENPSSLLADNVEYMMFGWSIDSEDYNSNDEQRLNTIKILNNLIKKYPNSDLRQKIEYEIIIIYTEMYEKDKESLMNACKAYLKKYPNDIRSLEVEKILNSVRIY